MKINELCKIAYEQAKDKGWHDDTRSVGDFIALMHSELSEALEAYREEGHCKPLYFQPDQKPEGVPIELADAVIRIADFCGKFDIDLEEAIQKKLAYNRLRPHRHGGKHL